MKKILALIIFLLMASSVQAIGLSPARVMLNFEPNLKQDITFTIVNTLNSDITVQISVEGGLAQYFTFEDAQIPFAAGESKKVKGTLSLPESIPGGDNVILLRITEGREETSMINVRAEVLGKIFIKAVYDGYYLEPKLVIKSSDINEDVKFELELNNFGKEDITDAAAFISIFDSDGNKIASVDTDTLKNVIKSYGKATLYSSWTPNAKPGFYKAKASVIYHDKNASVEQDFRLGDLLMNILAVPDKVESGRINEFLIGVENTWSKPINNVYADIIIKEDDKAVASSKTVSETINAWEKKTIKGFVDTANLNPGDYNIEILLHYEGKTSAKEGALKIAEQKKDSVAEPQPINKQPSFLVPLAIIIAILLITVIYLFIKKR